MIFSNNFTHSFAHFHTLLTQFRLFWPYFSQFVQVVFINACTGTGKLIDDTFTEFYTLLHTLSDTLRKLFTHLGLFWQILVEFQYVGCLRACTLAGKITGNPFTQFHTLLHILSHTLYTLFTPFRLFWTISV